MAKQLHWQAELSKVLQPHDISYFVGKDCADDLSSLHECFPLLLVNLCRDVFDIAAHNAMVNRDLCAGIMCTPQEPV